MDQEVCTSILPIIFTGIIGVMGIIVTVIFSRSQSKLVKDKMMKELFTDFNLRYDKLNDYLVLIEVNKYTLEEINKEENKECRQAVIDYFNLCAEEYFWYHHKKRIDRLVWNSWQTGMNYWYNEVPAIKALWEEEVQANGKASYYINDKVEFFTDRVI